MRSKPSIFSLLFNRAVVKQRRILSSTLIGLLALVFSIIPLSGVASASAMTQQGAGFKHASFTLDGVTVAITSGFLPGKFVVANSDSMTQMASSVAVNPYREFQIEAIPFSTSPTLESLPLARANGAALYRTALHQYRAAHGAKQIPNGSALNIFGQKIQGETNIVQLQLGDSPSLQTAVMSEYVAQAGNRLWLVRLTQEQTVGGGKLNAASDSFLGLQSSVSISSTTLNHPSTLLAALKRPVPQVSAQPHITPNSIASPSWWSGNCDYNNYLRKTGWQSWQMSTGRHDGVVACGPRPFAGGPDALVSFFPGAWGEYEWECVELAMRWMYLAYGIHPYGANGNQVVSNYSGSVLKVIHNTTACCEVPEPGDILSYCSTCTYGHTSVVMSTSVNSSGNGSIEVMEQNDAYSGAETLTVSDWQVQNTAAGWVYGYLHHV